MKRRKKKEEGRKGKGKRKERTRKLRLLKKKRENVKKVHTLSCGNYRFLRIIFFLHHSVGKAVTRVFN